MSRIRTTIALVWLAAAVPAAHAPQATARADAGTLAARAHSEGLDLKQQSTEAALRRATERFDEATRLWRSVADQRGEAEALMEAAATYRMLSDNDAALDRYTRALELMRALQSVVGQARALNQIAWIRQTWGENDRALEHYAEALTFSRRAVDPVEEAWALNGLARAHFETGNNQKTIEYHTQALSVTRASGNTSSEGYALNGLAVVYRIMGDDVQALGYFEQALALRRAGGDRIGVSNTLNNIGNVHAVAGRYADADRRFAEALEIARAVGNRRTQANTLDNMAALELLRGAPAKALELCLLAAPLWRAVGDPIGEARTSVSLGDIYSGSGESTRAAEAYTTAANLYHSVGDATREAVARLRLGKLERTRGRLEEARSQAELAVDCIESLRARFGGEELRTSYFASKQKYYAFYIDVLMALHARRPAAGHASRALEVSERAHARSMLDTLHEARVDTQLDSLGHASPLSAIEIQEKVLDADSVLLEYALGEERSYVWQVTRAGISAHELPARSVIEAEARRAYELLTSPRRRELRTQVRLAMARLSRMLLTPVAGDLGTRRLVIVPDGALQYLPFAALVDPADARGATSPLIVNHEVVTLFSASTLDVLRRQTPNRSSGLGRVAVVADPAVADREGLPFAREEAEAIISLAGRDQSLLAMDRAATRDVVMSPALQRFQIVHFATHVSIDMDHPERSRMVLAGEDANGEPGGYLRLPDVFALKLNADLVVLSGCRTALGKEIRGEGLAGMARGFMHAGASKVVASLWDIRDHATAELMRRFYQAMLRDGDRPAAALRAAQVSMWRDPRWSHPFYWASFELQGDWR